MSEGGISQEDFNKMTEEQRLVKRRTWLQTLKSEDRDFIARYGFELWEKKTGRKRDE